MLVLDRKIQEGFWIDGRIFVKVLNISRRRIKLGIEAPSGMLIVREELLEQSAGSPNGRNRAARGEQNDETLRPLRR